MTVELARSQESRRVPKTSNSRKSAHRTIDRPEKIGTQQLSEFPRIHAIAFVADFRQRIPARIADQHSRDMGLEQVVQPGRTGPFFEGHIQTAAQTVDKLQNG